MFHVEHRRMDYHLHTNHSMDGRQTMPELCETMLARGVQEIALTDLAFCNLGQLHFPVCSQFWLLQIFGNQFQKLFGL